jgi:hypothetical protein
MAAPVTFEINGDEVELQSGWELVQQANGRATLDGAVVSSDGSSRPAIDDEILATEDAIDAVIFGGDIESKKEGGLGRRGVTPITTEFTAVDFQDLLERDFVNGVIFAGTLKAAIQIVVDLMADLGVTMHPDQVDGPLLPDLTIIFVKYVDVFTNYFVPLSGGWVYRMDTAKRLRMFAPGTFLAPFNIAEGDGNTVGDVEVESSRISDGRPYANKIYLVYGGTPETIRRIAIVSNTAANPTVITTDEPHQLFAGAIVTISDNVGSNEDINDSGLAVTVLSPTTFSVPKDCTASGGTGGSFVRTDSLSTPIVATAEDLDEQAPPRGRWALRLTVTGISDPDIAQQLAEAYLAAHKVRHQRVTYVTYQSGAEPGQTQEIELPSRDLTGSFIIAEVVTFASGQILKRRVTAYKGTTLPAGDVDLYKQWSGGGVSNTAVAAITGSPSTGGTKAPIFLGGGETEWVINGADWKPASAVRFRIDTNVRGSVYGTVLVRLRARTGSVTARLRNIDGAGATVGISETIASTTWQDRQFGIVFTEGVHMYELQVLGSVVGASVAATGFAD